ncbi:hypothetical protein [Sphingobium nicotianae]|uniref:Uncharacterized protein n=1 Tax=Sphingobium nicotianae TaxID=2782607 RepID=A0A9X1DDS5_9SPHN|nr:hypothetical protein [Sphingobium nicotianae]MBT2188327.1 hypothetical protein [Sphingobium nicotianae]
MFLKLMIPTLIAMPAALLAQSPSATHEPVSSPGKSHIHMRPLAQSSAAPGKCHPDATKAVACEAHARVKQAEALARARTVEAARLSQR